MYVKVGDRWRYAKPVEGRNHKLKRGWCVVNGVEHDHPRGAYYIRYREGTKTIWQKCRNAGFVSGVIRSRCMYSLISFSSGLPENSSRA